MVEITISDEALAEGMRRAVERLREFGAAVTLIGPAALRSPGKAGRRLKRHPVVARDSRRTLGRSVDIGDGY